MIKVCTGSPLHWTDKRSYFGDMDGVQWVCFLNEKMLKKVFHTHLIQLQLQCSKDFAHFCFKCLSWCCITKNQVVVILVAGGDTYYFTNKWGSMLRWSIVTFYIIMQPDCWLLVILVAGGDTYYFTSKWGSMLRWSIVTFYIIMQPDNHWPLETLNCQLKFKCEV